MSVLADGYAMLPWPIQEGDLISFDEFAGWWHDVVYDPLSSAIPYQGYQYNGVPYYGGSTITSAGDPYPTLPHMSLLAIYKDVSSVLQVNQVILGSSILVGSEPDIVQPTMWFIPNAPVLDSNSGAIRFKVTLAVPTLPVFDCDLYDFTSGTLGWSLVTAGNPAMHDYSGNIVYGGEYVASTGFRTTEETTASLLVVHILDVRTLFEAIDLGKVTMTITYQIHGSGSRMTGLNDIWKRDPATNTWEQITGFQGMVNPPLDTDITESFPNIQIDEASGLGLGFEMSPRGVSSNYMTIKSVEFACNQP